MTSDNDMRSAVLSIGRIYCDLIFTGLETMPVLGREIFADDLRIAAGGGAFIMAAYSAHIGRKTALLARLGTDGLSNGLTAELETSGIDLRFVDRAADAGPQVTVAINNGEERAFLSRRAGGAEPATLGEALAWSEARHLHIAELATLAEIPGLVGKARENGLTVSLDPSWDETLIYQKDFLDRCAGVDRCGLHRHGRCALPAGVGCGASAREEQDGGGDAEGTGDRSGAAHGDLLARLTRDRPVSCRGEGHESATRRWPATRAWP